MLAVKAGFYSSIDEGSRIGKLSLVFVVRLFIENSGNQRIPLVIGLLGALLEVNAADFKAADTDNPAVITVNRHQEKTRLLPAFFEVGNVCQDILLGNIIFLGMQQLIGLRIGVDVKLQLPGAVKADVVIAGNLRVAAEHTCFIEKSIFGIDIGKFEKKTVIGWFQHIRVDAGINQIQGTAGRSLLHLGSKSLVGCLLNRCQSLGIVVQGIIIIVNALLQHNAVDIILQLLRQIDIVRSQRVHLAFDIVGTGVKLIFKKAVDIMTGRLYYADNV